MPRQPRLNIPGTVHHVIGRRIEGLKIFRNEGDTRDFLSRVAQLPEAGFWMVYLRARRLLCRVAVGRMGYPAVEVARFLGMTTSAVVRAAHSENHTGIEKYP